jgi:uncharacterized delta-60 repeat protein
MKRSAYLAIIAIAFSLSAAPLRAQDVTLHVDEASFLAAAGETQLIDFEGTVAPDNFLFLGDPGEFSAAGVVITNNSPMFLQNNNLYGTGAFLSPQQAAPQIVEIVLPPNTVAAAFYYQSDQLSVQVLNTNNFAMPAVPVRQLGFFGITSATPFETLTLTTTGSSIDLDNIRFVVEQSAADVTLHADEAAFLAAAGETELIDFEGQVAPDEFLFLGDPGEFSGSGVTITNNSPMFLENSNTFGTGAYLSAQQATSLQMVEIILPPNTVAASFNYQSDFVNVQILRTKTFPMLDVPPGQLGFFGVTSTIPFRKIFMFTTGSSINLDNIRFVVDPSASGDLPVNDGDGMNNVPGGGELVPTFGSGGTLFPGSLPGLSSISARSLGAQPDGKLIVAGPLLADGQESQLAVARLDESGVLDPTFGVNGVATVNIVSGIEIVTDLDVMSDGSIVVVGRTESDSPDDESFVAKLDADGRIDGTFGANGIVRTNLLVGADDRLDRTFDRVVSQPDGKLVMGAQWTFVYRYLADGNLDALFGIDGRAERFDSGGSFGLAVDVDGTIVSGGGDFLSPDQDFMIVRNDIDGSIAAEFGIDGESVVSVSNGNDVIVDLIIDSKRRIVAVGYAGSQTVIVRWLPNGVPDASFGVDGVRIIDLPGGTALLGRRIASRPDGGYFVAGSGINPELVLVSLHENGSLDTGFAGQGWVEIDVFDGPDIRFFGPDVGGLEILPNGRIALFDRYCICVALVQAPDWFDNDGDGIGDRADPDDDNDGIADEADIYPFGAFDDAGLDYWAYTFIERLANARVTAGCGNGRYCPEDSVTRAQMAVFLERGMRGSDFSPPSATGSVFLDVGASDFAAAFIEQLFADGITSGCGNGNYCPNNEITRAQMAVFLLRAKFGAGYAPPPASGLFADAPPGSFAVDWIEALAAEGISSGCGAGNFCPDEPVTRAQMAVFLVRTFGL